MIRYFRHKIWSSISSAFVFFSKNPIKLSLAGILALIGIFKAFGVWELLLSWTGESLNRLGSGLVSSWSAPVFLWYSVGLLLLWITYLTLRNRWYLGKVSGEFYDDFNSGLNNWDYQGEWKIEQEEGENILSITRSPIGGFTKMGFNWTDYEFSFETKIIKGASGWVIRANASDYFMVQLFLEGNAEYVNKLRPHYHKLEGGTEIWLPDNGNSVDLSKIEMTRELKTLQWIKVKILVESNQVDIYLDGKHALHYLISSLGVAVNKTFIIKDKKGKEYEATFNDIILLGSNIAGRVGFRIGDGEHAHFRKVNVKPLS